ncbi:hypothetical protein DL768_000671 [Monosporascus sp. mg162]|nr:hypothetical protein DL768_000671 [Monosporascus sp. mg162]
MQYRCSILITGGTSGLGDIAKRRPQSLIVLPSRADREQAAERINKALRQSNAIFLPLDLGDLAKALVLNAGLQFPGDLTRTRDGLETTFGINHVGHALLFHLLAPGLAPDDSPRRPHLQPHARPGAEVRAARRRVRHGRGAGAAPGGRVARPARATALRHQQARQPALGVRAKPAPARTPGRGGARQDHRHGHGPGADAGDGAHARRARRGALRLRHRATPPHLAAAPRLLAQRAHARASPGSRSRGSPSATTSPASAATRARGPPIKSSADSYDEAKQEDLWRWTTEFLVQDEEELRRFEKLR